MFKFHGFMKRRTFLGAAAIRLGLMVISLVAFPYILMAFIQVSGCRSVSGSCGALGLVATQAIKPLITLLFIFSFAGISMRRTRDCGGPAWIGLIIPALLAADYRFLTFAGTPWSFGFTHGVLAIPFPIFVLTAIILIAALCILPSRTTSPSSKDSLANEHAGLTNKPASNMPVPSGRILGILFIGSLALTFLAVKLSIKDVPFFFLLGLIDIVLPTMLIYFTLLLAIYHVVKLRSNAALAFFALTLLPFAHWGYRHWTIIEHSKRDAAEVAAIATQRVTRVPSTILVVSSRNEPASAVWSIPAIERQVVRSYRGTLMQTDRPTPRERSPKATEIAELPDEYLVLKIGTVSSFAKKGQDYEALGGPYELRLVGPQRDDLIAVDFRTFNRPLVAAPILTVRGWMQEPNVIPKGAQDSALALFLTKALTSYGKPTIY